MGEAIQRMTGREYYDRLASTDIGAVARELLRVTGESGGALECDCPHHASQGHRSLRVDTGRQLWVCFGCSTGGDVLQLVEFVKSGGVTKGVSGRMPDSHREARDWLAAKVGLPPLGNNGTSLADRAEAERLRQDGDRVAETLGAVAGFYAERLEASPHALDWLAANYALTRETLRELKVGYADNLAQDARGRNLYAHMKALGFGTEDMLRSGAFRRMPNGKADAFFARRVVFWYWLRGKIVYGIARRTPWTPETEWEKPKYKKLLTHSEKTPWVSETVSNSVLYGEDALASRPASVVVCEGVTDAAALWQAGVPVVSPVTTRIKKDDWGRLLPKLKGVRTVVLCNDNELSGAGEAGAAQTAETLAAAGVEARIVDLPLPPAAAAARERLASGHGISHGADRKSLDTARAALPEDSRQDFDRLVADSKVDVNSWFMAGGTGDQFRELMAAAPTAMEWAADRAAADPAADADGRTVSVLAGIRRLPPVRREAALKRMHAAMQAARGKSAPSLRALKAEMDASGRKRRAPADDGGGDTCRAAVQRALADTGGGQDGGDYAAAAEAALGWWLARGAVCYRTLAGEPFMFFRDKAYALDTGERGAKRLWLSFVYAQAGVDAASPGGRRFLEVLADVATEKSAVRTPYPWAMPVMGDHEVRVGLGGDRHQVAHLSPEGAKVLPNGEAGTLVEVDHQKFEEVVWAADADPDEEDRAVRELVLDNLTCDAVDAEMVLAWLQAAFLLDFSGTRPHLRFEGAASSGKSTAQKLLSALMYGQPAHSKTTTAAAFSEAGRLPLITLDNIEAASLSDELADFLLVSATGASREKRARGSESAVTIERARCMVCSSGIEPLDGGGRKELTSRTLLVNFDARRTADRAFIEAPVLARIRERRGRILSAWLGRRVPKVLGWVRGGGQLRLMETFIRARAGHSKRRCFDYMALMGLMWLAGKPDAGPADWEYDRLPPQLFFWLDRQDEAGHRSESDANPVALAVRALVRGWEAAERADEKAYGKHTNYASEYLQRYGVDIEGGRVKRMRVGDLFTALKRLTRDMGTPFPYCAATVFGRRIQADADIIRGSGVRLDLAFDAHANAWMVEIGIGGTND